MVFFVGLDSVPNVFVVSWWTCWGPGAAQMWGGWSSPYLHVSQGLSLSLSMQFLQQCSCTSYLVT